MAQPAKLMGVVKMGPGAKVEIHGLEKKPELNGMIGSCIKFDPSTLRWGVELPNGKQVALKMQNLRPVNPVVTAAKTGADGKPMPADEVRPEVSYCDGVKIEEVTEEEEKPTQPAEQKPSGTDQTAAAAAPAETKSKEEEQNREAAQPAEESKQPQQQAATAAAAAAAAEEAKTQEEAPAAEGTTTTATEEAPFELPPQPERPKTGRWFEGEAASEGFADQLLANDPKLQTLCLVPPKHFDPPDVVAICDGLEKNTVCYELLASGHPLSDESCQKLSWMLSTNKSLKILSVGDSSLGDGATILFEGLAENLQIESLDLEHKGLTEASGKALAKALASRATNGAAGLVSLRLSRNPLLLNALSDLAADSVPAPRELQLCEASLDEKHGSLIGKWAARGIEDLNLRGNTRLGADGVEAMLGALLKGSTSSPSSPPKLKKLKLDGCSVGDDGVEAIADAIRQGLSLEELTLESNELTSASSEFLASALSGIRGRGRLKRLSVRMNAIGDDGLVALATCAEDLDVSAADLGPRGFKALGEQALTSLEAFSSPRLGMSLGEWCSTLKPGSWEQLRHLDLGCSGLGDAGFKMLINKLIEDPNVMPKLESLCVGGNDIDESDEGCSYSLVESVGAARKGKLSVTWRNG